MLIQKNKYNDERGVIYTIFNKNEYDIDFVQDKITKSVKGTIRGFHGDSKTWKLITCLDGIIKLIIYNIENKNKQEYILDANSIESYSVLVPPKCLNAHQCLTGTCIFHYKWSEYYTSPEDQWSVYYNDPDISPNWNINLKPILSDRDRNAKLLKDIKI